MSAHSGPVLSHPPARTRPTGRAPALPPDERRQAIAEAVVPLLVEHGAAVTTRQLAEAAGVAEGTLFRVFDDKVALLHAAAHAALDPRGTCSALAALDPGLPLAAMVQAVAARLLEDTARVMAVLGALRGLHGPPGSHRAGAGPPESIRQAQRAALEGLTEVFARYAGELRVEPVVAARALRALVCGSRQPWAPDTGLTDDQIASILLTGIRTGGGAAC